MGKLSKVFDKLRIQRVKNTLHIKKGTRVSNYEIVLKQTRTGSPDIQEKWFVDLPDSFTIENLKRNLDQILEESISFQEIVTQINELLTHLTEKKKILFFT